MIKIKKRKLMLVKTKLKKLLLIKMLRFLVRLVAVLGTDGEPGKIGNAFGSLDHKREKLERG